MREMVYRELAMKRLLYSKRMRYIIDVGLSCRLQIANPVGSTNAAMIYDLILSSCDDRITRNVTAITK